MHHYLKSTLGILVGMKYLTILIGSDGSYKPLHYERRSYQVSEQFRK